MLTALYVIASIIGSVALGVFTNLVTPFFDELFRKIRNQPPIPKPRIPPAQPRPDNRDQLEAWRQHNRQRWQAFWWQINVFGASYFVMFAAIELSCLLAGASVKTDTGISFAATRLGMDIVLPYDKITAVSAAMAALLYLPCLWIAHKLANITAYFVGYLYEVNRIRYSAFVVLWMLVLALLTAGHISYLFNPRESYGSAILWPFMIFGFIVLFTTTKRR